MHRPNTNNLNSEPSSATKPSLLAFGVGSGYIPSTATSLRMFPLLLLLILFCHELLACAACSAPATRHNSNGKRLVLPAPISRSTSSPKPLDSPPAPPARFHHPLHQITRHHILSSKGLAPAGRACALVCVPAFCPCPSVVRVLACLSA